MEHLTLAAAPRNVFGKKVKSLRAEGYIPAELYGHKKENKHLSVPAKEFDKVFRKAGESTVVYLEVEGAQHPVLVHDIAKDHITDDIRHIDFYEVRMDEKIKAHVAIELVGEAPAVKEFSGVLNKTMATIEVEALPADLPHAIEVDVSSLNALNESIYVKDIPCSTEVKFLVDPETVIVSVTPPKKEEEPAPAVTDVSEVKVETEEKKAEREKKEGEGEGAAK